MSIYYDPELIEKSGTPVHRQTTHIPAAQRLVAVQFNGLYKRACDVTEESEYKLFYDQYYSGLWLSWDLYLVPEETPSHH